MAYPAKDFVEIVRVWENLFNEFHKNEPDQLSRKFNVVKDLAALLKQRYPDEQFEKIINKFAHSRTCFRMTAVAKKFAAERVETLKARRKKNEFEYSSKPGAKKTKKVYFCRFQSLIDKNAKVICFLSVVNSNCLFIFQSIIGQLCSADYRAGL